jgi:hypothetical protein
MYASVKVNGQSQRIDLSQLRQVNRYEKKIKHAQANGNTKFENFFRGQLRRYLEAHNLTEHYTEI